MSIDALSKREREVAALLASGLSNKRIADRLDISTHTAKFHVAVIIRKLRAENRVHAAVLFALETAALPKPETPPGKFRPSTPKPIYDPNKPAQPPTKSTNLTPIWPVL